jgi:hypothetical protein
MKTALLLLSVLTMMAVRVSAADTNLNQSIIVARPLDDVIRAMQTYYFSTNYHGPAYAVFSTKAVPGVSYTYGIVDCAFDSSVGALNGGMVATRLTASSTRLELVVNNPPSDPKPSFKRSVSRTLEWVAKIAEGKQ